MTGDDDDRAAPPGDWLTDRDRWRRRIASAILVIGVAFIVRTLSSKQSPTPAGPPATTQAIGPQ